MSDLENVKPEYVSNVAVDYWRLSSSSRSTPPFAVVSLSPDENRRIDCQPEHTVKLPPRSVDQADAMVTSAAVMALSPEQNEPFRDLQIMLGLILRKGFKTKQPQGQPRLSRRLCSGVGRLIFYVAKRQKFGSEFFRIRIDPRRVCGSNLKFAYPLDSMYP